MSDTTDTTIAALRNRLRELELDAVMIRGRVEELTHTLEALEGAQKRRGRGPARVTVAENRMRLAGGSAGPWAGTGHVLNDQDPETAA